MSGGTVQKVVLAYSGGLDTSVIVPWLRNNYGNCEVICFTADVGQEEELEGLEDKAIASGASKLIIADLREEFLNDYVFPTMQAGAVYEREYLLGTSIARPLMAKKNGGNCRIRRCRCHISWLHRKRQRSGSI